MNTICRRLIGILTLLTFTGCGGVLSVEPLSDDSNSVLDERLFGHWESERERRWTLTIRKKADTRATLEFVSERAGDERRRREVERTTAYALRDKYDLLSARIKDKDGRDRVGVVYGVCRYRLASPDALELFLLNEETLGRAVERGDLRGEVTYVPEPQPAEPDGEDAQPVQHETAEREIQSVTLSDTAERILDFIRRTGDDSFNQEPAVLRRVRSGAGSPDSADGGASGVVPAGIAFILLAVLLLVVAVFVRRFRQDSAAR